MPPLIQPPTSIPLSFQSEVKLFACTVPEPRMINNKSLKAIIIGFAYFEISPLHDRLFIGFTSAPLNLWHAPYDLK
jgi:hypothetical protein